MRALHTSRSIDVAALIVLAALVLVGCASGPSSPPTPITEMSQIEGKWQGTITLGFAGPMELYFLTINPDGSMVAQWGMNWQWGNVTLTGGPTANFQMTGGGVTSGTLTYFAGPGGRSLALNSTFGNWSVNVRPAR